MCTSHGVLLAQQHSISEVVLYNHAFKLTRGLPLPYVPLSEQVLSTLHAQFIDLRILIIDEISMVQQKTPILHTRTPCTN